MRKHLIAITSSISSIAFLLIWLLRKTYPHPSFRPESSLLAGLFVGLITLIDIPGGRITCYCSAIIMMGSVAVWFFGDNLPYAHSILGLTGVSAYFLVRELINRE
jgi:hypothetical protein